MKHIHSQGDKPSPSSSSRWQMIPVHLLRELTQTFLTGSTYYVAKFLDPVCASTFAANPGLESCTTDIMHAAWMEWIS